MSELGRVQVRTSDMVLGLRMRWRLGYHQAFLVGRPMPKAFGHYGYGGSGAWADPGAPAKTMARTRTSAADDRAVRNMGPPTCG